MLYEQVRESLDGAIGGGQAIGPQTWWRGGEGSADHQVVLLSPEVDPPVVLFLVPPDDSCRSVAREFVVRDEGALAKLVSMVARGPGRDAFGS
ncbi:MAG: hypothetical protein H7Y88_03050 [Phycisphaerales bacterium]|nr:hypothetical protein [Phycisphaerales bacterium]